MKRAFAAGLILAVCVGVFVGHAWRTWDDEAVPSTVSRSDREFYEYALFMETFAFMVSAAYFFGPRIYRLLGEERAATLFSGEGRNVSGVVHAYAAGLVTLRRLWFDRQMGVSWLETVFFIAVISMPVVVSSIARLKAARARRSIAAAGSR